MSPGEYVDVKLTCPICGKTITTMFWRGADQDAVQLARDFAQGILLWIPRNGDDELICPVCSGVRDAE